MDITSRALSPFVKNQVLEFVSLHNGQLRLDFMNGERLNIEIPNYQINIDNLQFFPFDSNGKFLSAAAILDRGKNLDPTAPVRDTTDFSDEKQPEVKDGEFFWPLPLKHESVQSYFKNNPIEKIGHFNDEIWIRFQNTDAMKLSVGEFVVLLYDNTGEPYSAIPKADKLKTEIQSGTSNHTEKYMTAIAESVNESFRILCKLGKVPPGSTVTKRTGEKLYKTRDGIRIFKKGGSERISPPENHTFLCADYGSFDCVHNDTVVGWVVSHEELLKYLETQPLPY